MFGFSFLILVSVSAYVANLAAFLTLTGVSDDFIDSVDKAARSATPVCANSVLRNELQESWQDVNFVWYNADNNVYQDIEMYRSGKCKAIVVSRADKYSDDHYNNELCELGLVYTNSIV